MQCTYLCPVVAGLRGIASATTVVAPAPVAREYIGRRCSVPCVCAWPRRLQMVPFAGYSLPVQYQEGVLQSHLHTRADDCASVFDVGHMGQIKWRGKDALRFLETLVVGDLESLKEVWMSRPPVSSPGACVSRRIVRHGIVEQPQPALTLCSHHSPPTDACSMHCCAHDVKLS